MLLLHVASFPLNDTPKPAGAVFFRSLIEPYSGIFDMALDMIGRLIYQIEQVFLCPRCLFPHTRFPSLARQHVGMLWMHISHTITHEYCHVISIYPQWGRTGRAEISWTQPLSVVLLFSL